MFKPKSSAAWQDPLPQQPYENMRVEWDKAASGSTLPQPVALFFNSVFALAFKAVTFLTIAIVAGGLALEQPHGRIGQAVLWGVLLVSSVLGFSFLLHALTLNLKQLYAIRVALQELQSGTDINGDGLIGLPGADLPSGSGDSRQADGAGGIVERVIDLIPTNRGQTLEYIEVGLQKVDRRDFIAFMHRAWETNGQPEKGLARVYWVGGRRKSDNQYTARFRFERGDGTTQECHREIYDAIMKRLETLGEIEGRGNGWSGKLRRDPNEWLGQAQWL